MAYKIIAQLSELQKDHLFDLYRNEFWSCNRQRAEIDRVLAGSSFVVGIEDDASKQLVGFCRVLTDYVYKAMIYDVIVAPDHRDRGLGKQLLDTVMAHPELQAVQQIDLHCLPEMFEFYRRWGFSDELGGVKPMRYVRPAVGDSQAV